MRNLLRKPLLWMVVVESAVVSALVIVAWHLVVAAPVQDSAALPEAIPPSLAAGATGPVLVGLTPPSRRTARSLLPGLNVDPNFWRSRLAELNRSEAAFEVLEWRLVHSAMDTVHRYVESVVLPSITRAERSGRTAAP